jgi:hypothetical protein
MQSKLFRRGPRGTLGDALVTVTKYQGFLPARGESVRVEMQGCAFSSRTVALTFGQRLDVHNLDDTAYMPRLVGAPTQVLRVAMQGSDPVPLFPPRPGQYALTEQSRQYMTADVFVLLYPTFDVTGLDGEFAIESIPAGDVTVSAYSPSMGKVAEKSVTVIAGEALTVDLDLAFSQAEYEAAKAKARAAAGKPR